MFTNPDRLRVDNIHQWQDNGFHAGAELAAEPTREPSIIGRCRCGGLTETLVRHAAQGRIDHADPEDLRTDECGIVKVYAIEGA
jgi:hypothetical protein